MISSLLNRLLKNSKLNSLQRRKNGKQRNSAFRRFFSRDESCHNPGEMNLPNDYSGKWFVLFSHPGDFTPVCTTEFYSFQKRVEEFKALNCELIGLSVDQVFAHIKWEE